MKCSRNETKNVYKRVGYVKLTPMTSQSRQACIYRAFGSLKKNRSSAEAYFLAQKSIQVTHQ